MRLIKKINRYFLSSFNSPLSYRLIHPIGYLLQPADPMQGLAAAAQAVTLSFKQAHPRLDAMMDKRVIHLHAFLNRTAVIFKGMDKQRRRNALICRF